MLPPSSGAGDGAIVTPCFAYGIAAFAGNIGHLDGQKLIFPAGQHFTVLSPEDGKASFIATSSSVKAIHGMRLSANKKYMAVVENTWEDDQQQVSVYNVAAEKRVRTLSLDRHHTHASSIVALSFSGDAKLLLVAGGEPDYAVMLWRWQSSKLLLMISPELAVGCAVLNPWDEASMALAGPHLARTYRLDLATASSTAAAAARPNNVLMLDQHGGEETTCLAYLVGGLLAVGTSGGMVLICSEAGLLHTLNISAQLSAGSSRPATAVDPAGAGPASVSPGKTAGAGGRSSLQQQAAAWQGPQASSGSRPGNGVQAIVQRGRGLLVAGSRADVYVCEPPAASSKSKGPGQDAYVISRRFCFAPAVRFGLSSQCDAAAISSSGGSSSLAADARVLGLSVSATDDQLALTTASGKLLLLDITAATAAADEAAGDGAEAAAAGSWAADGPGAAACCAAGLAADGQFDEAEPNPSGWQVLCAGFSVARVVGLDACTHLPLLLVAGEDRWVRVLDWVRRTRVAARHLDEQPLCCALHPSGLQAVVGTSEGLRLFHVLRRELAPMAELPVAKCSVARYSHGGAMLAAAGRTNAIVIYPAYYGTAGASGASVSGLGGSSHFTPHSHYSCGGAAAAAAGVGAGGACVLRPLQVLKAHVSTVTDLAFSGDNRRLVSSGAGGAVYFWDLATGSRLMDLEYVDKKSVYYALAFNDRHQAAVARTMDGRLQHLQDGQLVYEVSGLGTDCSPMSLTGEGRVLLAATSRGSIISIGWPKDPAAAGLQQQQQQQQQALMQPTHQLGPGAAQHASLLQHLSVQVGLGALASPGAGSSGWDARTPGSSRTGLAGTPSGGLAAGTAPSTPLGNLASARAGPKSPSRAAAAAAAAASHAGSAAGSGSSSPGPGGARAALPASRLQQHGLAELELPAPGSPQGWSAAVTPASPRAAGAAAAGVGAGSAAAVAGGGPGMKEFRLHGSRITAMKVLHSAGLLFTASADGLVMMSSLSIVLDGILTEPPPLALPPSATAAGSTAAAAAALSGAGSAAAGSGATALLTATGIAAGLGAPVVAGGVPGLPPAVVLVDEGLLLVLRERLRGLERQLQGVQKEAQYQVMRQTQALKESLGASDSQAAALAREVAALRAALADSEAAAAAGQQQVVRELEALHGCAAEELEGLYEARLALEGERLRQLAAAKDDLELSLREEMRRQAAAAEQQLADVHSGYRHQLASESARSEGAAALAAEAAAVWQEVLLQTEEDLEQQAEHDGERLAAARHEAGELEVKLKAEINTLLRSNARLKADKAADTARISELNGQLVGLQQKNVAASEAADRLRRELEERDSVIADNYASIQGLRRRVQELETHKFVLSYKAEAAAAELQPKEEQLVALQDTLHGQDHELLASRSALLAAQRSVGEKAAAISALKREVWEVKQTIAKQAGLLEAVAHDIFQVLQQPDERQPGGKTARQHALEALAVKFCSSRGGGPRSSAQVEAELAAHIAAAEKKSAIHEGQLHQALAAKKRGGRRLMADNASLIADLSDLQHTNKDLARQLAAATSQLADLGLRLATARPLEGCAAEGSAAAMDAGAVAADAASPRTLAGCSSRLAAPGIAAAALLHRGLGAPSGLPGSAAFLTADSRPSSGCARGVQGASTRPVGQLLPSSVGRVLTTALEQQQQQLAELQAALDASTNVVVTQCSQLGRLQSKLAAIEQQTGDSDDENDARTCRGLAAPAAAVLHTTAGARQQGGRAGFAQGLALSHDAVNPDRPAPAAAATWRRAAASRDLASRRSASPSPAADAGYNSIHGSSTGQRPASTGRMRPSTAAAPAAGAAGPGALIPSSSAHQRPRSPTAANLLPKRRPTTAGGVGMMACLRSDIEAWRARG